MDIGKAHCQSDLHFDMINIRPAVDTDQQSIMEIYNEAVRNTTATFDTEERTIDKQLEWFRNHKKNHPVFVAEADDEVVGWASLSAWSERSAYDETVEVSVYIRQDQRSKGIGKQLLQMITLEGKKVNNHTVIARISAGNDASIHIHEVLGYTHIGTMKDAGKKFGKYVDVHLLQIMY